MTIDEIRQEIMGELASSWATATPIAWPNHSFTAPASSWIRPVIKMGSSYVMELGDDGIGQRNGMVMISTFTLPETGLVLANYYANRLEGIFRRADINGVVFEEPASTDLGIDATKNYNHVMTTINFFTWIGE
jgi:hypothetical protein